MDFIKFSDLLWFIFLDGGESYEYKELPLGIYSLQIHPLFPTKVLASRFRENELYYSSRFGDTGTWSLISDQIIGRFDWTPFTSSDHPDVCPLFFLISGYICSYWGRCLLFSTCLY